MSSGHEVIAVARTHEPLETEGHNLTKARADVRDPDALTRALDGANAVVSALGVGTSRAPTDVYSTGVRNTLAAMRSNGATKLAVISAVPAWGTADAYLPSEQAQRQRQSFPSARIELLDGHGHWVFLEDPERAAAVVVPFLR